MFHNPASDVASFLHNLLRQINTLIKCRFMEFRLYYVC